MSNEIKYARKCDACNKGMNSGYVIEAGMEYYCSDTCLHTNTTHEEYLELYDNGEGDSYHTSWDEVDDDYYYNENGDMFTMKEESDFKAIRNFLLFGYNYPQDWIESVWLNTGLTDHIKSKFKSLCHTHDSSYHAFCTLFFELDSKNQKLLSDWISENYEGL